MSSGRPADVATTDRARLVRMPGGWLFLADDSAAGPDAGLAAGSVLVWARSAADIAAGRALRIALDADGRVAGPHAFTVGGVRIEFDADVRLEASAEALHLRGGIRAIAGGADLGEAAGGARIALGGGDTGVLEIPLAAAPFEASFRYFWGPADDLQRASYPVFGEAAKRTAVLRAHPHRDHAELRPGADGPSRYATAFRTPLGHPVDFGLTETSGFAYQYDPVSKGGYAVLAGAWTVHGRGATAGAAVDLMLGTSGIEYARVPDGAAVVFAPGGAAYAPSFGRAVKGATALSARAPGVDEPVTTSWLTVQGAVAPGGPTGPPPGYYSQPQRSPFYEAAGPGANMLRFLPIDSGPVRPAAFPAVPYAGVAAGPGLADYARFEVEVLGTARRNALLLGPESLAAARPPAAVPTGATGACHGPTGPLGPPGAVRTAVTPRGLLAAFDASSNAWRELRVLQADHGAQTLRLTEITAPLRGALLANQLFLVATDREKLLAACSVEYQLTAHAYAVLAAMGPEQQQLARCTRYLQGYVYQSRPYFDAVLRVAIGDEAMQKFGDLFRRLAAKARFVVRDWTFDLSPYLWEENGSCLILKYSDLPLEQLVADPSLWTAQDAFLSEPLEATRARLTAFLADAARRAETDPDFRYFSETVARNRGVAGGVEAWNGVLCLDCAVPVTLLPPQLQGLAAGIDAARFRAHHVGISASAISAHDGVLAIEDSSVFGLIAYEDPGDLSYAGRPYDYKVLLLKVLFASSQVTGFASQVELLVGELFGERSSLPSGTHGDNLVLNGVWQRRGDVDSYAFTEQGDDAFVVASDVLDTVTVRKAEFATVLPDTSGAEQTVETRFLLTGSVRFKALEGCDLFSFGDAPDGSASGGLSFANLAIRMSFDPLKLPATPPVFSFDAGGLLLDASTSRVRDGSLFQRFPLRLSRLVQGSGSDTPESLGFMKLYTPLAPGSVSGQWFGLAMDLNLGSQGGLAARAGFFATVLAAWAPSTDGYKVWAGLQLPGSSGAEKALTIMGPLKLKMADLQLLVLDADQPGRQAYLLKFANVTLSFLSVSLPPGARVNALLFGNPDPNASTASLGWYAAYAKDKDAEKKGEKADGLVALPSASVRPLGGRAVPGPRRLRRI